MILSVTPAYIAVAKKEGKRSARVMSRLKERINRPLAAILTVNTLANMIGAAGVGAQTLKTYGDEFVAIASAVLTFAVLILSEIIPKTLGATHWKRLAPLCAHITYSLMLLTYPLVLLAERLANIMGKNKDSYLTRAEMIETAEIGVNEGTLRKKESSIIKNLLMLDNIYVYDIMTPKSVMFVLHQDMTVGNVFEKFRPIRYSRIPIFDESKNEMIGIVHRYKILEAISNDKHNVKLKTLMSPVHAVHESLTISSTLDEFIKRGKHLFVVNDDYKNVVGIVTLEDAIETLLGVEIVDELDSVADLRAHALEIWKKRRPLAFND